MSTGKTVNVLGLAHLQEVVDVLNDAVTAGETAIAAVVEEGAQASAAATGAATLAQQAAAHATAQADTALAAAGLYNLGREPRAAHPEGEWEADPPGQYRYLDEIIVWDGEAETGRSAVLASAAATTATVLDIPALRTYAGPATTVIVSDPVAGGVFNRDPGVTRDDNAMTILGVAGWRRSIREYNIQHYGGRAAYGSHDNTPALNAILAEINHRQTVDNIYFGFVIHFPGAAGDYYFLTPTDTVESLFITFLGDGESATRIVGSYPGALFQLGRAPGANGEGDLGKGTAHVRFKNLTVKHPYSRDLRYYRAPATPGEAGRIGWTDDPALVAAHPEKYEMIDPDPPEMEKWVIFDAASVGVFTLENVNIDGCYQVAWFGGEHPAAYCSAVYFVNVRGWTYNRGLAAITVHNGAGFSGDISSFFTQAEHPAMKDITIDGEPYFWVETMTTLPGTNMFNIRGHWDTWGVHGSNSLFERFWSLYSINVTAGHAFSFITHSGVVADYLAGDIVDFEGNQGTVSLFDVGNMRVSPIQGRFVNLPRNSGYVEFSATNAVSYMSGREVFWVDNVNLIDFNLTGGRFHGAGFLPGAQFYRDPETLAPGHAIRMTAPYSQGGAQATPGNIAAARFGQGVKRFRISGADFNRRPGAGSGTLPWYSIHGVLISADCDEYSISDTVIDGQFIGLSVLADATPSTRRRVSNVQSRNTLEFGYEATELMPLPPSGQTFWNTFPYTLSVSVGGGAVQQIEYRTHGGLRIPTGSDHITGRTDGEFTLRPGQGVTITYTEAPIFVVRALP